MIKTEKTFAYIFSNELNQIEGQLQAMENSNINFVESTNFKVIS